MSRLKDFYRTSVVPALMERYTYPNPLSVPRIEKIVVSMGVGRATQEQKRLDQAVQDLTIITGQKPVVTKARKSVSQFRVREGWSIGCMVTLRGRRMYDFLDRLINVVIPRVRDFSGLKPGGFDGRANFSMGLSEQGVFPEINLDKVEFVQGMNITMVTSARTDEEGFALLDLLGMPFRRP